MSIILDHINYCYSADSAYKVQALKDVSLEINDGEFIGIIGHTGSGKSTLIQHMNGLLKATSGHIYYNQPVSPAAHQACAPSARPPLKKSHAVCRP